MKPTQKLQKVGEIETKRNKIKNQGLPTMCKWGNASHLVQATNYEMMVTLQLQIKPPTISLVVFTCSFPLCHNPVLSKESILALS